MASLIDSFCWGMTVSNEERLTRLEELFVDEVMRSSSNPVMKAHDSEYYLVLYRKTQQRGIAGAVNKNTGAVHRGRADEIDYELFSNTVNRVDEYLSYKYGIKKRKSRKPKRT